MAHILRLKNSSMIYRGRNILFHFKINQFISHDHDPITLLIELDKMFPEIQKSVEEVARLNFELHGFGAYPVSP